MLSFTFVIVCGPFEWKRICRLLSFVYICIAVGDSVWIPFQQYFSFIFAVRSIGRGNRSTWRTPPPCRKSLTKLITTCCIE